MGANQSLPNDKVGYHVLKVFENSPADDAGIEPFFDFIITVNGIRLVCAELLWANVSFV